MAVLFYISLTLLIVHAISAKHGFLRDESEEEIVTAGGLDVAEYCAAVHAQYTYFCRGIWTLDKIRRNHRKLQEINKFCPSYRKACVDRNDSSEEDWTPEDRDKHVKIVTDKAGDMAFEEVLEKLEEIVPCRPNCDVSRHPHCTRRCKCEYEAKRTQKWCRTPSPRNEYFCQLWYFSCSEYLE